VTDVSVIVIAMDVRDEVLACLASVKANASGLEVETILVDNASSDGTAEAVAGEFPETRVIRLPRNEGLAARNHGLRAARGRLRMFLDSDALLTPGALPSLVKFMESRPEVGLVGPRLVYPDGRLQLSTRRFPPLLLPFLRRPPLGRFLEQRRTVQRHLMAADSHDHAREVEYVLGACQLFRDTAQQAAGELDPWMFFGHDDADWCFRMRMAGFKVAYCPEAVVIHDYRRSTAERPLSAQALRFFWIFYRFQWKWRGERSRLIEEGRRMDQRAGAL
jgi:GT2 family glycosyltransferase